MARNDFFLKQNAIAALDLALQHGLSDADFALLRKQVRADMGGNWEGWEDCSIAEWRRYINSLTIGCRPDHMNAELARRLMSWASSLEAEQERSLQERQVLALESIARSLQVLATRFSPLEAQ